VLSDIREKHLDEAVMIEARRISLATGAPHATLVLPVALVCETASRPRFPVPVATTTGADLGDAGELLARA
jgi:hypothetical protein